MKKKNLFISNALLLSVVNIVMRGISVSFSAYINRKIGAESMGLFTLVMNVYGFAVTLALSCVNLGAVKLTSERSARLIGADRASWKGSMRSLTAKIVLYSCIFGVTAGILLFMSANPAAEYLLGDMRTVKSLRLLSFTLPAISLSSALSGFFTGLRKVYKNALSSVGEQLMKIVFVSTGLYLISPGNVEDACLAVVGGSALSEAWSLVVNALMYFFDSKKPGGEKYGEKSVKIKTKLKEVTDISFTAALGTYARQGLNTLEHLAIPRGLKKSGLDEKAALSSYGLLQGIAFPLVMFPYAVIGAFTSLLIPEIAEKNELGDREGIKGLTGQVYRYSAYFSLCACGIFVNYSSELGNLVFGSDEAARYTAVLGILVPFMYLDTAVDSLLKGLGEQVYNMKVNIADSACGLLLVMLLTPRFGIGGYVFTVFVCEIGNLSASLYRLSKRTNVGVKDALKQYIRPVLSMLVVSLVRRLLLKALNPIISMLIFAGLYCVLVNIGAGREGAR